MTGLALAVLAVAVFCAACWWRAYVLIRYDRERDRRIAAARDAARRYPEEKARA